MRSATPHLQDTPTTITASQPAPGLLHVARELLIGTSVAGLVSRVPGTLRRAGSKISRLSTTEKAVGGALLAAGAAFLLTRGKSKPATAGAASRAAAADTLNELLYFVNDRIAGYERAVAESQDADLRGYYKQLVSQSQQFATVLNSALTRQGGERQTATTVKGKLYRGLMSALATVTGHDEQALLAANIHGEAWAIKAYEAALDDQTLAGDVRQAVERQLAASQQTQQKLEQLVKKAK